MATRRQRLSVKERDTLIEMLIDKYETSRQTVTRALPEIAQHLEGVLHPSREKRNDLGKVLTPIERAQRLGPLQRVMDRLQQGTVIAPEEAIKALEDSAALLEDPSGTSEVSKEDLLKLVKIASGLSLSRKDKPRKKVFQKGEVAKSVNVIRGVTLHLTWDTRLIAVEVNPQELKRRDKAFQWVGISVDKVRDVSERHDIYLLGEPSSA